MADFEINLPPEWTERTGEKHRDPAVVECKHTTADDVTFVASVVPRADRKAYNLHLLTIDPTPARRDYPVKEYGSRKAALAGTESFVEHLSHQLQNGSISSANPETEEIREALREFSDDRLFPSIQRLISLLR